MQRYAETWMRSALVLSFCLVSVGCMDADFESVSMVSKLRLLGLEATPPEVAPGESTSLAAVIATPTDAPAPQGFAWSVCLLDEGADAYYRCAEGFDGLGFSNTLFTSDAETPVFTQDLLTNEQLHFACEMMARAASDPAIPAELAGALPTCTTGLPVRVRLAVCEDSPTCEDADAHIVTKKMLLLFEEHANREDRNANPPAHGLAINGVANAPGTAHELVLSEANEVLDLLLVATAESTAQRFEDLSDDAPTDPAARETLQTDWYTTSGELRSTRRYFREGITNDDEFRRNRISLDPATLVDGEIVRLWVIIRDSRGGASHVHQDIIVRKQ